MEKSVNNTNTYQIAKISKTPIKYKTLEVDEKILEIFKEMYENMGDLISE